MREWFIEALKRRSDKLTNRKPSRFKAFFWDPVLRIVRAILRP